MKVKARERTAILQSLAAGVVPAVGLHHIQVGRKLELEALISDLSRIEQGGAAIRYVIGRFGSGKSFFLNLVRTVALERKFVVAQADVTIDRRFSGKDAALALYTELINGMSTRARPDGGAMPGLVERFVSDTHKEVGDVSDGDELEQLIGKRLQPLLELTHGSTFVRVLAKYVEGFSKHDDNLTNCSTRWLRGEYKTKTEARQDLGVRDIIEDSNLYDLLKVWSRFVKLAGYSGLFVNFDELVVLSERLNNSAARTKNYEVLLQILNDCLQGGVDCLGFCFAGTDDFLTDRRRGLYSYEALATRLAENQFAVEGAVDMKQPVIRLQPLTREDVFVLLERIAKVHASGIKDKPLVDHDGIVRFLSYCDRKLGAQHFLTPRDSVKQFSGLLNVLEQNPQLDLDAVLKDSDSTPPSKSDAPPDKPPRTDSDGDALANFKL